MEINPFAILLSAISAMAIGFMWYSPMLFGNRWMKLSGITPKDIEKSKDKMSKTYTFSFLLQIVLAVVLSYILKAVGTLSLWESVKVAFIVWLGFVATTHLVNTLYLNKPYKLFAIDAGYHLATIIASSVILSMLS